MSGRLFIRGIEVPSIAEITISTNYVIADIRNPEKRNTDYTKTVDLPGNDITHQLFQHIYDCDVLLSTFNPNKKEKCVYMSDDNTVLVGDLQLLRCNVNVLTGQVIYQVNILGRNSNLFFDIGDKYLTGNANPADDLDFSTYNHGLNPTNIINSWATSNMVAGSPTALIAGTGYRYPVSDYGYNNLNHAIFYVKDLRPLLFIFEILQKIFASAGTGWTWSSTILNSAFFKTITLPSTEENILLSQTAINNSQFYAARSSIQTINKAFTFINTSQGWDASGNPQNSNITTYDVIFNDDSTTPLNDPGNQYNNTNGIWTVGSTNSYSLQTIINYDLVITPPAGTVLTQLGSCDISVSIMVYNGTNWQIYALSDNYYIAGSTLTGQTISANFSNITFYAGNNYKVAIFPTAFKTFFYSTGSPTFTQVTTGSANLAIKVATGSRYYLNLTNNVIVEGATLELNQVLPKQVKQKDFVTSIIKMFNLYFEPSKTVDNQLVIESYADFFNAGFIDMTAFRDADKGEVISPMGLLDAKTYTSRFKADSDYYNDAYVKEFKENYGSSKVEIDNDFLKNENVTEVIFSPTPLVGNAVNGLRIPTYFKSDNGTVKNMKCNTRILIWGGLKNLSFGSWTLRSTVSGDTTYTNYPYAGHLDDPYAPTFDLNFHNPRRVYYTDPAIQYTDVNIVNYYYAGQLKQITDQQSKIVKRFYKIDSQFMADFTFRKKIFDDEQFYLVNSIINYDPNKEDTVEFELLKLIDYSPYVSQPFHLNNNDTNTTNTARQLANRSVFEMANDTPNGYRIAAGSKPVATIATSDYITDTVNKTILVDASSNNVNVTLKDNTMGYTIKRIDNGGAGFVVTITPQFGQIEFRSSITLLNQGDSIVVEPINGNWYIDSKNSSVGYLADGDYENTNFTGSTITLPSTAISILLFKNGQKLTNTVDYTVSGGVITFVTACSNDIISIPYKY